MHDAPGSRGRRPRGAALFLIAALAGCETNSSVSGPPPASVSAATVHAVSLDPCRNRIDGPADRDLAAEASVALRRELERSAAFAFGDAPDLRLSCDVERYKKGSALKRWIMPGAGGAVGQIKIGVWSVPDGDLLGTIQAQARISGGGLYTLGAETYILDVAAKEAVAQLEAWAERNAP